MSKPSRAFRPTTGDDCVYSAISLIRDVCGYKTPYPRGLKKPLPTPLDFITDNAQKFFSKHKVKVWAAERLVKDRPSITRFDKMDAPDVYGGPYIFMYDYSTLASYDATGRYHSHTVVGIPNYPRGTFGMYVIRVTLK